MSVTEKGAHVEQMSEERSMRRINEDNVNGGSCRERPGKR